MSRDPAFLFYDGDAARDVSHMSRLERGCYFDLMQAQRKFGGYTVEQARKILSKDFDDCWPAIELILKKDGDVYYIEWLKESILKRVSHAEKQRVRIQQYWDKKNKSDTVEQPRNNRGNSLEEIENEIENVVKKDTAHSYLFDDTEFKDLWNAWLEVRKQKKIPNTPTALKLALKKLENWGSANAKESLRNAIEKGWRGVFFPQNQVKIETESLTEAQQRDLEKMNQLAKERLAKHGT